VEWFAILYGILGPILSILIIAAVVYIVVRSRNGRPGVSAYQALIAYFYFVTAVSFIAMTVGAILFLRVAINRAFDGGAIANDLTLAGVLLGTGLVICALHVWGRRVVERRAAGPVPGVRRTYLFFLLGSFSLAALVALPVALYQAIRYYTADTGHYGSYQANPSTALAVAVVLVPLWGYLLFRVLREIRHVERTEEED